MILEFKLDFAPDFYDEIISVKKKSLQDLYHNFIIPLYDKEEAEPTFITLPSEIRIPYNNYAFHKCFDHGAISETKLISILSINLN